MPVPLPHDSWDDTLALTRSAAEPHGRDRRTTWPRSIAMVVGVGAIVVLVMLTVGPVPGLVAPWSGSPDESSVDGSSTDGPGLAATHSDPASPPSSADPSSTGSTSAGGSDSRSSSSSTSSSSTSGSSGSSGSSGDGNSGVALPPPAVVVEAESASVERSGSATVTADSAASGGAYVSGVGNWSGTPGVLVFTGVDLPSAGNWQLTITFLDPGPKGPRHATVDISGATPVDLGFAGWPVCCGTRTVQANLSAGAHTVTISNAADVGPCIDRISFTLLP